MDDLKLDSNEVQHILAERARLLARAPRQEATGETLDVVIILLETERYGIEVDCVSEIQPLSEVTPIPGAPAFWVGLVNLRSHLVPLLDLRAYLGLTPFPLHSGETGTKTGAKKLPGAARPNGQIVMVNAAGLQVGLLVDGVIEMQHLLCDEIGPSLKKTSSAERVITQGLTADLLTILDLDKLLSDPRLIVQDEAA
jgi:purine-binding chemotaxis protein CheW